MTAPFPSSAELLVLHAVRLLGMGDDEEVAARFGLDPAVASELLLDFQAMGWLTRVEFAGTVGWTLTTAGRTENERRLADELAATDSCRDHRGGLPRVPAPQRRAAAGRNRLAAPAQPHRPAGRQRPFRPGMGPARTRRLGGPERGSAGDLLDARQPAGPVPGLRRALRRGAESRTARRPGVGQPPQGGLVSHRLDAVARRSTGHPRPGAVSPVHEVQLTSADRPRPRRRAGPAPSGVPRYPRGAHLVSRRQWSGDGPTRRSGVKRA